MWLDNGTILKGIGGFYYVKTTNGIFECKLRGKFRKKSESALVGDKVEILVDDISKKVYSSIEKIYQRKNYFIRPPISNIDKLFIVVSVCDPEPNILIIDELIAIAVKKNVEPILIISKTDLKNADDLLNIYTNAGIKTILFSKYDYCAADEIKNLLKGNISAFTGNSGVGKSTILNLINESFRLETGVTSKKLGRGKHTTRHVELLQLDDYSYVADTPGFSRINILECIDIKKENLIKLFKDLEKFSYDCKFKSCSHICEEGCSVIKAFNEGKFSRTRYESYKIIYQKINQKYKK